jgi:hypothetical protein
MPTPLSGIDERINYLGKVKVVKILPAATTLMRDIVLDVLCGATMGLFVAMVGDFF